VLFAKEQGAPEDGDAMSPMQMGSKKQGSK
jgi:hypothetical protein